MGEFTQIRYEVADHIATSLTRAMMWPIPQVGHPIDAHGVDSRAIYRLSKGADAKEGVESFLQKRKADYPGRVSRDMPEVYPWWDEATWS